MAAERLKGRAGVRVERGFREEDRDQVARMFWEAFSGKLGRILGPQDLALRFLHGAVRPSHALTVLDEDGTLLGVAGYKTQRGGFVAATYGDLARVYGAIGAVWRGVLLDLTDRPMAEGQFLMDGIFVASDARGRGVGTTLIEAIMQEAARQGMQTVRLDVIDRNPRARALYERLGFIPTGKVRTRPFGRIFGFREATTMTCPVPPRPRSVKRP
ncbi:GNAT family N-acetyltransferase [Aliiruegeria haliotis]|uniref:GNAT family N-acetyltransferase n=1 Tax=Aliiruegeria haliotis TaxID=1280846 RepID=UPI001FE30A89|nr:GNAT family N-acetyltransferase [Aliiruegeria haliotis]